MKIIILSYFFTVELLLRCWGYKHTTPPAANDSTLEFTLSYLVGASPSGCQLADRFKTWSISHFKGSTSNFEVWGVKLYHPYPLNVFFYFISIDFQRRIASKVLGGQTIPPNPAGTILRLNLRYLIIA